MDIPGLVTDFKTAKLQQSSDGANNSLPLHPSTNANSKGMVFK